MTIHWALEPECEIEMMWMVLDYNAFQQGAQWMVLDYKSLL